MREVRVAWLYARTGAEPTNLGLVDWLQLSGKLDDTSNVWEHWEDWFRNLIETHTLAPVLAFVPTVHRSQTWLIAAAVILDAASFYLSALDVKGQLRQRAAASALLCHTTGVRALRLIAAELADHQAADVTVRDGSNSIALFSMMLAVD